MNCSGFWGGSWKRKRRIGRTEPVFSAPCDNYPSVISHRRAAGGQAGRLVACWPFLQFPPLPLKQPPAPAWDPTPSPARPWRRGEGRISDGVPVALSRTSLAALGPVFIFFLRHGTAATHACQPPMQRGRTVFPSIPPFPPAVNIACGAVLEASNPGLGRLRTDFVGKNFRQRALASDFFTARGLPFRLKPLAVPRIPKILESYKSNKRLARSMLTSRQKKKRGLPHSNNTVRGR
ncbi:hypothetical protein DFW101_1042 [Solidesulfovibrio carbinoliphilus subsp. oakridgensis]|uniref:Uncharacterized protein n=1 Tax=Solidesulfovibrio carbinoliphilus subsp. oakridgensis TaxID=694327 RepID=G7Q639_9BACT|nr:hypothetical protein DFW101_1042 [Solidesulfovibrio carbinoliphilus subsp. oakridgensis]